MRARGQSKGSSQGGTVTTSLGAEVPKLGTTQLTTLEAFKAGKTIQEVATIRGFALNTIQGTPLFRSRCLILLIVWISSVGHLAVCIYNGQRLDIERVRRESSLTPELYSQIARCIDSVGRSVNQVKVDRPFPLCNVSSASNSLFALE